MEIVKFNAPVVLQAASGENPELGGNGDDIDE